MEKILSRISDKKPQSSLKHIISMYEYTVLRQSRPSVQNMFCYILLNGQLHYPHPHASD